MPGAIGINLVPLFFFFFFLPKYKLEPALHISSKTKPFFSLVGVSCVSYLGGRSAST